jgi:zinc transport system permease protein
MLDFFETLPKSSLLQMGLLTALLAGIASGIVGSYVVVRRITGIAGAIAHCVLGGLGAAQYLAVVHGVVMYDVFRGKWVPLEPLVGAIVAALLAAGIIGWVTLKARQREDTVINAIWAVGMAVGLLFIHFTPGYNSDLMSYLFGSINLVSSNDIRVLAALDVLIVGVALLFYDRFLAVCFDEEFARLRGLRVEFWYLALLALTALTVVLLVNVVGIVLVIALLTLPVAIAGHFTRTLMQLMALSVVISIALTSAGLAISYGPNLPTGATTIVLAGVAYLATAAACRLMKRPRSA